MIPVGLIARAIMGITLDAAKDSILQNFKQEALEQQKREAFKAQLPAFKALIAEQVANAYAKEIKDRSEGYVKAVETMSLEMTVAEDDTKDFSILAENALKKLEVFIENQGQEGPIISYLKTRYKEEDIKIITGRLYGAHYIKKQSEGVYSIYNRKAYAPLVDKNKPWLSSDTTSQRIGEIIAEKASEFFAEEFDIDLGDDPVYRG